MRYKDISTLILMAQVYYENASVPDSLFELYEKYEDILCKHGIVLIKNLLPRMSDKPLLSTLSEHDIKLNHIDTVLEQKDLGPLPYTKVSSNVSVSTFFKQSQRSMKQLRNLYTDLDHDIYWNTIKTSYDRLKGSQMDPKTILQPDITFPYGIIMNNPSKVFDIQFPDIWSMHSTLFSGPRNLLTDDIFRIDNNVVFPGMCSPHSYYYLGTIYTSFSHHFEDYWLPSVNYLLGGAPKHWISLPQSETRLFWDSLKTVGKLMNKKRDEKKFLMSPDMIHDLLGAYPTTVVQEAGDIVISASGATHGGFNTGINLAEAVNFVDKNGDDSWITLFDDMQSFYMDELDKSVPDKLYTVVTNSRQ